MTTPILRTSRLILSPPFIHEGMDVRHYLGWLANKYAMRFSENRHLTHTKETQYEYLCSFDHENDHFWDILKDGKPIGSLNAYLDIPNRTANLGILIGDHAHWGYGYGPEAWEAVCDWLFSQDTRKIEASCMASNGGMISVLTKNGFDLEATIPGHFLLDGKPEDKVCYGKTKKAKIIPLARGTGGRESVLGSAGEVA